MPGLEALTAAFTTGVSSRDGACIIGFRASAASIYSANSFAFDASLSATTALNWGMTLSANSFMESVIFSWLLRPACCIKIT